MACAEPELHISSVHQHLEMMIQEGYLSLLPIRRTEITEGPLPAWLRLHGTGWPTQVPGTGCWMASTAGLASSRKIRHGEIAR